MQKTFLFRLYRHSKVAFIVMLLFMGGYVFFFFKKMDTVMFPYNGMFASSAENKNHSTIYAIRLNGKRIPYSNRMYWKKDFLEQSLSGYISFQQQQSSYLKTYLDSKQWGAGAKDFLRAGLIPSNIEAWPLWYCKFAGSEVPSGSVVELFAYTFDFKDGQPVMTDSSMMYKLAIP
ncbi:MAG: hypothetical protein FGM46_03010 [Ferruginibacter sp.]|nr:hypothetical protein [Ferruginibacter sp.]